MTSLTLATILQASIMATGGDDYAEARRHTTKTSRPMVILVGADWCPACVEMKNKIVPQVRRSRLFRRVTYAFVDLDRQPELGRQLTSGGHVPQVIMYRKTVRGWRRRRLIGGQSAKTVETFIKQGIRLDEQAKKTETAKRPKSASKETGPT